MEEPLPAPPPTVIVVDDHALTLSCIRSVLEAHALPYEVQVIDRGDPALALLKHLTQHESRRAPTVILLNRQRPQPRLFRRRHEELHSATISNLTECADCILANRPIPIVEEYRQERIHSLRRSRFS